jgi:hypothetical protein
MKKALLARLTLCLLLLPSFAFAGDKKAANPADYPLIVHVVASYNRGVGIAPIVDQLQTIDAVIDGKSVELQTPSRTNGVLALGDYKAKLIHTYIPVKNPGAYDIDQTYQLLFSDGRTRDFVLVGLRDTPSHP